MSKFNPGDKAYIIESTIFVKEVVVVKFAGGMYLIKYPNGSGDIKLENLDFIKQKQKQRKLLIRESKLVSL